MSARKRKRGPLGAGYTRIRQLAQHARGAVSHDLEDADDPVLISTLVEAVEGLADAVELLANECEELERTCRSRASR